MKLSEATWNNDSTQISYPKKRLSERQDVRGSGREGESGLESISYIVVWIVVVRKDIV